ADADTLRRIDVCWSMAAGMSQFDLVRSACFQAEGLRLALEAGDRFRLARALCLEVAHAAAEGETERGALLLRQARALAEETGSPHARSLASLVAGFLEMNRGGWRRAVALLEDAAAGFRDHSVGVAWEATSASLLLVFSLYYLGELAAIWR